MVFKESRLLATRTEVRKGLKVRGDLLTVPHRKFALTSIEQVANRCQFFFVNAQLRAVPSRSFYLLTGG
jgi:hypothetical protein